MECHNKLVRLNYSEKLCFSTQGDCNIVPTNIILTMTVRKMFSEGYHEFLAVVKERRCEFGNVNKVLIVGEFSNVFLTKLSCLPLEKEIEVCIDLVKDTSSNFIPSYRMASAKLKELKD